MQIYVFYFETYKYSLVYSIKISIFDIVLNHIKLKINYYIRSY